MGRRFPREQADDGTGLRPAPGPGRRNVAGPADLAGREVPLLLRTMPMILMYHGVAEVTEDPNKLCVTRAASPSRCRGSSGAGCGG